MNETDYYLDGDPIKTADNWCFGCGRPLDDCRCPDPIFDFMLETGAVLILISTDCPICGRCLDGDFDCPSCLVKE